MSNAIALIKNNFFILVFKAAVLSFLVVRGSCHTSYKKCDHHCVEVSIGHGECRCKPHFKLDSDGKSCKGRPGTLLCCGCI